MVLERARYRAFLAPQGNRFVIGCEESKMSRPRLIVVAGPPAAGKTTIARQIAAALRMPVICKDTLKEALYGRLGSRDRAWSQRLGAAVIQSMYALAEDILRAGASLILESTFIHPDTPGELQALMAVTDARLSVIYCHAAPEVLSKRYNARARTDRHPGHRDQATMTPDQVIANGWLCQPEYPGRTIEVDTTESTVSIEALLEQLHI
jgi:predicted kinase